MLQLLPDRLPFLETKSTISFLLDHPRRCYTTLFPSTHTWWLLGTLIVLNGTDWVAFEILNVSSLDDAETLHISFADYINFIDR